MRRMRQARKQKRAPGGQPVKAATCRGFRWSTRLSLRPVVAALCRGRRGLRLSLKELLPPVRETLSSIPLSGIGLSVLFRRYPVDPLSTKLTTKLATKFGGLLVGRNSSGLRRQPRRSFRSLSTKITTRLSGLPPVRETSSSILSSIPLSGIGLSVLFRRYPVDPLSTKLTTKFGGLLVGRNSSGLRRQSRWAGSFFSFPSIQPRLTHLPRGEDPGVLRFHPETPHLRAHLFADFLKCRIVNEIR